MRYETPFIYAAGDAPALVRGTKGETPVPDSNPSYMIQSANAYEADE